MLGVVATIFAASLAYAQTPGTDGIILRDLAGSRFFGTAANTTFLFNDKNYTEVISTQVRRPQLLHGRVRLLISTPFQYSIFTPENESE